MNEQLLVILVGLSDWTKKVPNSSVCVGINNLDMFCNSYKEVSCMHCPLLQRHGKKSYWSSVYQIILSTKQ